MVYHLNAVISSIEMTGLFFAQELCMAYFSAFG